MVEEGVEFSVCPRDEVINALGASGIKTFIRKTLDRCKLMFVLLGEYSPDKHRLHYHGVAIPNSLDQLDKAKSRLNRAIGRTQSSCICNTEQYLKYIFKSYEGTFAQEERPDKLKMATWEDKIIVPKWLQVDYEIVQVE